MYFLCKFATIILGIYLRQLSPLSLSMMASRFIVSVGALMLAIAAHCTTLYSTWLNDFGYFSLPQQARIVGKRLIIDNTTDKEIAALISAYREIAPRSVMLYSIDRATPEQHLEKVGKDELERIAEQIRAAGIQVQVNA